MLRMRSYAWANAIARISYNQAPFKLIGKLTISMRYTLCSQFTNQGLGVVIMSLGDFIRWDSTELTTCMKWDLQEFYSAPIIVSTSVYSLSVSFV